MKKTEKKMLSSLWIPSEMHSQIVQSAKNNMRTIQAQVRWLLELGIKADLDKNGEHQPRGSYVNVNGCGKDCQGKS